MLLESIKTSLQELGFEFVFHSKSENIAFDLFAVLLTEEEEEPQHLSISLYPTEDELDDAVFVQFYFQSSFQISPESLFSVLQEISKINRIVPLGHFNTNSDNSLVYFKYVLAYPKSKKMTALFLNDILDMSIFCRNELLVRFETFSNQPQ